MGEIKYILDEEQIRNIVMETIALVSINKTLAKPQLKSKEAHQLYGYSRVSKWIKSGLLKPECQNGRGSIIYYSHKRIIELSKQFHHGI